MPVKYIYNPSLDPPLSYLVKIELGSDKLLCLLLQLKVSCNIGLTYNVAQSTDSQYEKHQQDV